MTLEELGRWCADYNAFQQSGLIPRWTDKLFLDNDGYVRDFEGKIVGYYGELRNESNHNI